MAAEPITVPLHMLKRPPTAEERRQGFAVIGTRTPSPPLPKGSTTEPITVPLDQLKRPPTAEETRQGHAVIGTRVVSKAPSRSAPSPGSKPTRTSPPKGLGAEQKSAKAMIEATLAEFGLSGLGEKLWKQFLGGAPVEQIFLDLRKTPEYKARFPAMEALSKAGRAIDENTYINLERSYTQIFRAAGLPRGFYDEPSDFGKFISGEVSPQEVSERVNMASTAAFSSPPELRQELARLYGVGPGDLTAFFIDPDRALPLLQQRFLAAQTSGAAQRTGFGGLTQEEAERLAGLGVSEQQATEGFGSLARSEELFGALPGEGVDDIGRATQLAAAFEGDADALETIRRRRQERVAVFEGGGGFAATREGTSGLGSV